MKTYHPHAHRYLHETIDLGSGRSGGFTDVFVDTYQPMMDELGARPFGIWETTPFNGRWPQVTIIWEIDAFAEDSIPSTAIWTTPMSRASCAAWNTCRSPPPFGCPTSTQCRSGAYLTPVRRVECWRNWDSDDHPGI